MLCPVWRWSEREASDGEQIIAGNVESIMEGGNECQPKEWRSHIIFSSVSIEEPQCEGKFMFKKALGKERGLAKIRVEGEGCDSTWR